ncbi:MAG: hypothetical protein ACRD7E_28240, partial [Bryobacteraceae bacterium]
FTGEPTYEKWLASLKAGNGFVTNGPMLTFEVEGHGSGEVVSFAAGRTVKARATARSILPFQSVEIVVNGETALSRNVSDPRRPGPERTLPSAPCGRAYPTFPESGIFPLQE